MTVMRTLLLLALFLLSFKYTTAQKESPPGTIQVTENFFFDKTEISNINWTEYLYWTQNKYGENSDKYLSIYPDSNVWGENNAYKKSYLNHPAYNHFPVVGVTHEQAKAFCSWRSDRVNEFLYIKTNKIKTYDYDSISSFIPELYAYRLPTKKEWESMALKGYDTKTQKKLNKKFSDLPKSNFKRNGGINSDTISKDITAPTISYWPNTMGVYNLLGNVAEMVEEKEIAKGGGWNDFEEDISIEKDINYTNPTSWLGFRCVCEKHLDN